MMIVCKVVIRRQHHWCSCPAPMVRRLSTNGAYT